MNAHVDDLRNIALVGHGAVGKTTLAELMLHRAGESNRLGSVDEGTSSLDSDDEERERHFSTSAHLVHFDHNGTHANLIDTPGYPDFIGQTISALHGVETAVIVIAADSGLGVNTRKVFVEATVAGLGKMILLNKLDHENIDFEGVIEQIQTAFGKQCLPLNVPNGLGADFSMVLSVLDGKETSPVADIPTLRQLVIEAAVECDEQLLEKYLGGEEITGDELRTSILKAIAKGALIPIFCTCAKTGIGVPEFMDAITLYALPPGAISRTATDPEGHEVSIVAAIEAPLIAQVIKTRIDPFVSKLSYLRLFSGKLTKDMVVHCSRTGKQLKIHQLFHVQGGLQQPCNEAVAGDIVAVAKMEDLQLGDTVCNGGGDVELPRFRFPTPMIGLAVEPKSRNDQQKISGALHKIEEEDPTFKVTREAQTHEMVMQGMSDLHLQIIQNRLQRREKVEVVTHKPKIPYRETISGDSEGSYRHKKQSGGAGQFAEVHMRLSHLPQGIVPEEYFTKDRFLSLREYHYDPKLNYAFVDRVSGGSIPNQFIPAVEKGVRERMEKGVVAGYQVQDICVELYFGKDHPVDSNETAFRVAGSMAFRNLFRDCRPTILEPIVHVEILAPNDKLGDITSDLNTRRGRVEGMDSEGNDYQIVKARAPLSEMATYSRSLSGITGGRGSFTMEFSHYEALPAHEQQKVIAAAVHAKEEEE